MNYEFARQPATALAIVSMADHDIPQFIRVQTASKCLFETIKTLNSDIFCDDTTIRERARAALKKLGFVDV